ncbi:hypothetical protein ANN_26860 [Periplaneta americana]|uniref:Uncharacterized protein n=1 Tax=Periplaneta americana TaxID=6978 RepID=A0ABQ8RZ83_PERAM|nr:hypothetical protein ANN_26860 [Periplaneta americana]
MKYGQWQEEDMSRALAAARNGDMVISSTLFVLQRKEKSCFFSKDIQLTGNLDALDIARENGVVTLPGHITHTYGLAATIRTKVNEFAKTGVWPVNRDVFHDCHFVAAMQFETDDVAFMQASTIEPVNEEIPEPNRPNTVILEKGAITSGSQDSLESLPGDAATLAPKLQVSIGEISLISNNISLGRSANKAQKMIVITSSPYKQKLEEVKSKQLKGDVLKILHRRRQLKPNSRFLQMDQRGVILTRSHVPYLLWRLQQLGVSLAANIGTIGSGLTLGYSAVALPAMQAANHQPSVTEEEASWIGHGFTRFKIIPTPSPCRLKEEQTVNHIILRCATLIKERRILRASIIRTGQTWPPPFDQFTTTYLKSFRKFIKSIEFGKM